MCPTVPKTATKTAISWKWQRASLQNFLWLLCMYKYVAAVLCLYYSSPVSRTFRSTSLTRLRALLLEMEWFERMSIGHHQDRIIILKVTSVVCCGFPRCIRWARNVRIRKPNNARVVGLLRPDSIKQVCFGYSKSVYKFFPAIQGKFRVLIYRRTKYSVRCLQVATADYVPKTSMKTAISWKWQRASLQNFSWLCVYTSMLQQYCVYIIRLQFGGRFALRVWQGSELCC